MAFAGGPGQKVTVHPPSMGAAQALPQQPAPARFPRGTGCTPATVAPSRAWRGSPGLPCAGPSLQHYLLGSGPKRSDLRREFSPAMADCRYRVPPAPRLARSHYYSTLSGRCLARRRAKLAAHPSPSLERQVALPCDRSTSQVELARERPTAALLGWACAPIPQLSTFPRRRTKWPDR